MGYVNARTGTLNRSYPIEDSNGTRGLHQLDGEETRENALQRIRTASSISISPELFEKIYLSPENQIKGDLRKMLGNSTPL